MMLVAARLHSLLAACKTNEVLRIIITTLILSPLADKLTGRLLLQKHHFTVNLLSSVRGGAKEWSDGAKFV